MEAKSDFELRKHKRTYVRQKLSRNINKIDVSINDLTKHECLEYIEKMKQSQVSLCSLDEEIGSMLIAAGSSETAINSEFESVEAYERSISNIMFSLNEKLSTFNEIQTETSVMGSHIPSKLKLPEIPLPKFNNYEGESLAQFFINFENILDKYSLADSEKFIFLEKQLSNEPLTLIRSLSGAKRSYSEAKDILFKAFARPIKEKFNAIKKLEFASFDTCNPFKFVSEIRLIMSSFEEHKVDIDTIFSIYCME